MVRACVIPSPFPYQCIEGSACSSAGTCLKYACDVYFLLSTLQARAALIDEEMNEAANRAIAEAAEVCSRFVCR